MNPTISKKSLLKWNKNQEKLFKFMSVPHPYRRPKSSHMRHTDPTKILSLSDPHEPYANRVVLDYCYYRMRTAEILICPGDLGDYYSKSRFKRTRYVSFADELRSVFKRIEWMANSWKVVKIMIGNHDNRPEKNIAKNLQGDVDTLIMTETNILELLASYFDNVEIVATQLDDTDINLTHIYQYGDIIFTHGEISLKQSSAILERVQNYLDQWSENLQLKSYSVLAQAHNHRDFNGIVGSRKCFLLPTASNPFSPGFEYIYSSRMIGSPPQVGFSTFYQERGLTDINRSLNTIFRVSHGKTQPLS